MSFKVNQLSGFAGGGGLSATTVDVISTSTITTTATTVTLPSSIDAGDLIIVYCRDNSGGTENPSPPAGWERCGIAASGFEFAVYAKIADGTESSTELDVMTGTTAWAVCFTLRADVPIEGFHVWGAGANTSGNPADQSFEGVDANLPSVMVGMALGDVFTDSALSVTGATMDGELWSGSSSASGRELQVEYKTYDKGVAPDNITAAIGDTGNQTAPQVHQWVVFGKDDLKDSRGNATFTSGSLTVATNGDVTLPTTAVGDFLVMAVAFDANNPTGAVPSGWNGSFDNAPQYGTSDAILCIGRLIDGTEGATVNCLSAGTSTNAYGVYIRARGPKPWEHEPITGGYSPSFSAGATTLSQKGGGCRGGQGSHLVFPCEFSNTTSPPAFTSLTYYTGNTITLDEQVTDTTYGIRLGAWDLRDDTAETLGYTTSYSSASTDNPIVGGPDISMGGTTGDEHALIVTSVL